MKVIFKRALLFRGPKGEKFHVTASANPQDAPEWLRSTSAFKHAAKDGVAIEVVPPKVAAAPAAQKDDPGEDKPNSSVDDAKDKPADKKAKAAEK